MLTCKLLGERYQVVQLLSQGAFCQTYLAQDIYLPNHPSCVVKHFLPSRKYPISVEIRKRLFTREVEALKKLNNYDLVPQLLAHLEDNLEFYLVQEFIEGHLLSTELSAGCCWSESKVFQLLQEVLDILNFVHSHGIIHRDVKPSNIIRRKQDNRLILIDFGAAKPIWERWVRNQEKTSKSIPIRQHTTIAIGTPGYMPNEQQRGKPRPNSDIYALGMICIQALTGLHPTQLPEDSNTGEVIWQHHAQVSPKLASVLKKMVHYHFKDRYKSAKEILQELLPLANLYTPIQKSGSTLPTVKFTFEPQLPSPEQDINQFVGDQASAPLLDDLASDNTLVETFLPQTNLYPSIQELDLNPSSVNNTIFNAPNKFAWLIGLVLGAVSGLILMIVSYWSLQIVNPAPQIQNLQLETPKKLR